MPIISQPLILYPPPPLNFKNVRDNLTILASQEFRKRPSVTTGHGHFFQDAFLSSLGTVFTTVIYQIKTYTTHASIRMVGWAAAIFNDKFF